MFHRCHNLVGDEKVVNDVIHSMKRRVCAVE